MSQSKHSMITRSKQKIIGGNPPSNIPEDDVDENGNLKGLIDYECDEEFDNEMFQNELKRLRGGKVNPFHSSPKKKSKKQKNTKLPDLFLS